MAWVGRAGRSRSRSPGLRRSTRTSSPSGASATSSTVRKDGSVGFRGHRDLVQSAAPLEPDSGRQRGDEALEEDIVLHPVSALAGGLAVEIEERVERLAVLPGEVLLHRPVEGLERGGPGAPFQVMPQLVGQRLPRLGPPVEAGLELRRARRRSRGRARSGSEFLRRRSRWTEAGCTRRGCRSRRARDGARSGARPRSRLRPRGSRRAPRPRSGGPWPRSRRAACHRVRAASSGAGPAALELELPDPLRDVVPPPDPATPAPAASSRGAGPSPSGPRSSPRPR